MKIVIFGAGGTGTNWCKLVADTITAVEGSDVSIIIVDGSSSNLRADARLEGVETWLCPDTDGAAKERSLCAKEYIAYLASRAVDILKRIYISLDIVRLVVVGPYLVRS